MITEAIHRNKIYFRLSLIWPDLALIRMEINSKTKKSTYLFPCTAGYLNNLFVPAVGHLPVCFQKMLMPRGRPGGGWALLEMTDALHLCPRQVSV